MQVAATIAELRKLIAGRRSAGPVSLVPTMGFFHAGHLALMHTARERSATVVVSIFVNPLQFGPQEDLERYPRDLPRDLALAEETGVDVVFAPPVEEMYPEEPLTHVDVARLGEGLCGASRPGHFRGVATVVAKLFNIVQPDRAFFGWKDAQQLQVIRRMAADLNFPVEIVGCPIVREPDGLAMSSRNTYLSPEQRQVATVLFRSLMGARDLIREGERSAKRVEAYLADRIAREPLARLGYAEIRALPGLERVSEISGEVLLAVAVFFGTTRLIDNIIVDVGDR